MGARDVTGRSSWGHFRAPPTRPAQIRTDYQNDEEEEPFDGPQGGEMGGGTKERVRLGDVRPSEKNPRREFGDIAALARSIEATGGEPVNPMVLVRDGNVFRIVDGERRFRALSAIHGEDDMVDALVFDDYGDAAAVVAMVATDDKMRLTPEEQALGFQSMMALGVDEDVTAKAVGRDVDQVRRARRSLSLDLKPEQMNLDVLVLVGDEEFSDDERAELLAYGSTYSEVQWKAWQIRDRHDADQKRGAIRVAMPDCIEFHDELVPSEDMSYVCEVRSQKEASELSLEDGVDYHAYPEGTRRRTWKLYRRVGEGERAVSAKEAKAAAEREERDRKLGLMGTMRWLMMEFVCDAMRDSSPMEALPMTCAKVMEARRSIGGAKYSMDFVCLEREGDIQACEPSPYEVVMWLDREVGGTDFWWNTPWAGEGYASSAKRTVALVWDALVTDGWVPPKGIAEVRDACGKVEDK